ncbi:hypothetical protein FE784_23440 [Paenibacillus hemerocallicola]|uniref:Uncharacterized protein n=1 Tax=Paenibacillus hemerocallicola TaxID=1172614 RepID=A0A5C4T489_9BACL|nr:hypothetical protein [Paenibacillus hemerocallicola]TNJ63833.1 hypothetical protein FE784_23440 [Paenibacillus hemerocallicola]
MKPKQPYNPYLDSTLHLTIPDKPFEITTRDGFNDVIKHGDIVQGHQFPKQLNEFPHQLRSVMKWGIRFYVASFIVAVVCSILDG